ncbi:MAG: radical SAM family heme chaperone HemW [Pseudomonadota bacterium]
MGLSDQAATVALQSGRQGPGLQAPSDWTNGGFGIYVHWPFCSAKCPYCDFNSHVSRSVDHALWREALVAEAGHMRALTGPRGADTMFFGGGTPSLMEPATVAAVIGAVEKLWGLAPGAEITLEANPTSIEAARLRAFAEAGVNRVSMGVQALRDPDLKALGRMHSVADALAAFDTARTVFDRVSFDLIYARMGQSPENWATELAEALALGPDHLSLYQLAIEDGTRFAELHARGRLDLPEDGPAAEMYEITQEVTAAAGLPAYEISNHARPGSESRHNLIYWRLGDYAGIGPGAHGRITGQNGLTSALATERDPAAWLQKVGREGNAIVEDFATPSEDRADEYLMMALRLREGAETSRYEALAGRPLPSSRVEDMIASGHLNLTGDRLRATAMGRLVLNSVLAELLV